MSKILLMTDSGSDIGKERAEEYGIKVLPLKYSFDGEKYYRDGVDQTLEEFYEAERNAEDVPKTSQVSPLEFEEAFNEAYENGYDTVIYTALSGKASGTCQNAMMVAKQVMEEHPGFEVVVIDSEKLSFLYGCAVIEGAKTLKNGGDKDAVVERIKTVCAKGKAYFITGDLTHLKKGGRINAATFAIANMLDIKPILIVNNGLVEQGGKIRGSKNLYKKLVDAAKEMGDFEKGTVLTIHTCMYDKAAELKEAILKQYPDIEVKDTLLGPTIASHGGPDLIGIIYFDDNVL